jgi:hypothetical protein
MVGLDWLSGIWQPSGEVIFRSSAMLDGIPCSSFLKSD